MKKKRIVVLLIVLIVLGMAAAALPVSSFLAQRRRVNLTVKLLRSAIVESSGENGRYADTAYLIPMLSRGITYLELYPRNMLNDLFPVAALLRRATTGGKPVTVINLIWLEDGKSLKGIILESKAREEISRAEDPMIYQTYLFSDELVDRSLYRLMSIEVVEGNKKPMGQYLSIQVPKGSLEKDLYIKLVGHSISRRIRVFKVQRNNA